MNVPEVDVLVLGAGWTSQFLVKLFNEEKISYALTTTTGKINKTCEGKYDGSQILQFAFQPDPFPRPDDYDRDLVQEQYMGLPRAKTVIVTFKLEGQGQSEQLIRMYSKSHPHLLANFIQLGSTGVFKEARLHSREDNTYERTPRAIAEDEFIQNGGSVLALAGLWGADRVPWNWVKKVANTKEKLRAKQALHLIHGWDVAVACRCMHANFYPGDRSIITDGKVYDWWVLIGWWAEALSEDQGPDGSRLPYREWLTEIRREAGVSNSRSKAQLGRVLTSDAFWNHHRESPRAFLTYVTKAARERSARPDNDKTELDADLTAAEIDRMARRDTESQKLVDQGLVSDR